MGKRRHKDEDEEHRIRRKIRKLKKKLKEMPDKVVELDSDDSASTSKQQQPVPSPQNQEGIQPGPSQVIPELEQTQIDEDILPEEFLLALGSEGEEKKETGHPIRPELALRWSRIITNGLGKEARDQLSQKYPIPENLPDAVAPMMNPEILCSLTEPTVKRDKRIMARQNITGKLMACLGKALTSVLKGDINSKTLIEEINDAAKLAAEMFYQDSASRKFFALAGAKQTVKEAVRFEKPDGLLFGKNCAEKIKTAEAIQKTGSQIKSRDMSTKASTKPQQIMVKKSGNWRGPPQQNLQNRRGRGGHHQQARKPYVQPHHYLKEQNRTTGFRTNYHR